MSTLYICLIPKAVADPAWQAHRFVCRFAWVSTDGAIAREGNAALEELAKMVSQAQRVVLLLAASDVTLLRVQVPPLSPARLKAALPHLVEDQLATDLAESVVVAGKAAGGLRTIAVVHRGWLKLIVDTLKELGARRIVALPAQLCLPYRSAAVSAAIFEHGLDINLAVRLSKHTGIGLAAVAEQPDSIAHDAVQVLRTLMPAAADTSMVLYVPPLQLAAYQRAIEIARAPYITVRADAWRRWIAAAEKAGPDLTAGLGMRIQSGLNWRRWYWSLALTGALIAVQVLALNAKWWHLTHEADVLQATMLQTFKTAYPKQAVILDPLAQMRQKISIDAAVAGRTSPDDFTALAATLADAWGQVAQQQASTIAALEYRDRTLFVHLKPGTTVSSEQMKTILALRHLSLAVVASDLWQIRSGT